MEALLPWAEAEEALPAASAKINFQMIRNWLAPRVSAVVGAAHERTSGGDVGELVSLAAWEPPACNEWALHAAQGTAGPVPVPAPDLHQRKRKTLRAMHARTLTLARLRALEARLASSQSHELAWQSPPAAADDTPTTEVKDEAGDVVETS